jgi:UDP-3-O-[3-hydroxymyristoyl] glucosamine N-acyltransferase
MNQGTREKVTGSIFLRKDTLDVIPQLRLMSRGVKEARIGDRIFRRHRNRNGTLGGFVESTAKVTEFVTMSPTSLVLENASVREAARLDDSSVVAGNANVTECARLQYGVFIGGTAAVGSDIYNNTTVLEDGVSSVLFEKNSFGIRNPDER